MSAIERKAVERLIEAITKPNFSTIVFADAMRGQHPAHQQAVMRAFMACIDQWYEMYALGYYDTRNQGTVYTAARIREALDPAPIELPIPYL